MMIDKLCTTRIALGAALAIAVLAGKNALAADLPTNIDETVFASVGIGGLNLGYGKRFNSQWGGRVMLNSGVKPGDADVKLHGNRYEAQFKSGPGLSVLADYYPIENSGFRVTGGLHFAKHELQLDGDGASYQLNGHTYSSAQSGQLKGESKYRNVAPFLGVGWESKIGESGWRFNSDLGARFLIRSNSTLNASGAATNATLRNDLAAEKKHLERNGAELVLSVGVSYAF